MKYFIHLLIVLLALVCVSCTSAQNQLHLQTANAVATAANTALPILIDRYRLEGDTAIQKADTKDQAQAQIQAIKKKWEPVWKAWETLRVAEDAWASALESDGDLETAITNIKHAYCNLVAVWPNEIPQIPLAPVQCR